MYKYFTKNNTCCYLDVIDELLTSYNNSVHSTIGMPPSKEKPSNIHSVWQRMNTLRSKIPQGRVKFKVGDLVRITKEKLKSANGYEQTFLTEIFRVSRLFSACPNLSKNSQTCRLVLSKDNFTVTSLSRSLYHPKPSYK
jgi:hypothetical protein